MKKNTDKTVAKWNRSDEVYTVDGFKMYWELLEEVGRYQYEAMTGGLHWLDYIAGYLPALKQKGMLTGLAIGCNYGEKSPALAMAASGAFRNIRVVDIAQGLLERQEAYTTSLGLDRILEYRQMDLDREPLRASGPYDLIVSLGTIHHLKRLEGLFKEINHLLHPDGLFCMREYIGPNRLQFTDLQTSMADRILAALPDHLKQEKSGAIKTRAWRPTVQEIMDDDPSEAVRSSDILAVAHQYLAVRECKMTGGTLLDTLLHGIADNFDKTPEGATALKTIIVTEQLLVGSGVLPSDYVFLIAGKKGDVEKPTRKSRKKMTGKEDTSPCPSLRP